MFKDFVHLSVDYRGNKVFEHLNIGLCASQERVLKVFNSFFLHSSWARRPFDAMLKCSSVQRKLILCSQSDLSTRVAFVSPTGALHCPL